MRFSEQDKRPDTPRALNRCGATVAPGRDARWRNVPKRRRRIDPLRVRDLQRRAH